MISMFLGNKCPNCGYEKLNVIKEFYEKLNVIKELEASKYECECEKCGRKSIVNQLTDETTIVN